MADVRLIRKLSQVESQVRLERQLRAQALATSGLAVVVGLIAFPFLSGIWLTLLLVGVVCAGWVVGRIAGRPRPSDRQAAALLVERRFPELDARLLTAIRATSNSTPHTYSFLECELVDDVLDQFSRQNWAGSLPQDRLQRFSILRWLAVAACLLAASGPLFSLSSKTPIADQQSTEAGDAAWTMTVEPGNVELERGTSLLVLARFNGTPPGQVDLVATDPDGNELRQPLQQSLADPLFGGRIAAVTTDLKYHIEYDGVRSEDYTVKTFEFPELLQANAELTYPEYTRLEKKLLEDVRQLTLLEGTQLDLKLLLNKPVRSARLVDNHGVSSELQPTDQAQPSAHYHWLPPEPGMYQFRLELVDDAGRTGREPAEFRIQVIPNLPPDLKISFPARDLEVTSLQEVLLKATASDDFGLTRMGLVVETTLAGAPVSAESDSAALPGGHAPPTTIEFEQSTQPDQKASAEHLLALESLNLQVHDLVSYYFFADDLGPDGQPRRTISPMYFAEVRPFDQIYRQGEDQQSQAQQEQEQQPQNTSQRLLELQRDVVSGSWNTIRESLSRKSPQFLPQTRLLADSQVQVRDLAGQTELEDPLMKQFLTKAVTSMEAAAGQFEKAHQDDSLPELEQARVSAQDAFRWLLQLKAREKSVVRSQGRQGNSAGGQSKLDKQLEALQLANDRNRYETERQARGQRSAAQNESLAILDQLKELARRQEDLNNRIRELETAMRNAESAAAREEVERQLKRLQAEQQEMLRNVEDLQQRMQNMEKRQDLADAREQVDETRERVMRASEALKEGQTSRALTEGTRAERDLRNLQEDFRKQSAGDFDENVRELRQQVRDLAEAQQKLGESLRQGKQSQPATQPTLRPEESATQNRDQLVREFLSQRKRLGETLDSARELVQRSETSEPLLSRKLYDTLRELQKYQPEESLENAAQMSRYGLQGDAIKLEEQVRQGIEKLQAGVEDAARGILGDEQAGLQQAQADLNELIDSVRRELAEKGGDPQQSPAGNREPSAGSGRTGDHRDAGDRRDDRNPTEGGQGGQPGERSGSSRETPDGDPSQNRSPAAGDSAERGQSRQQSGQPSRQQGSPAVTEGETSDGKSPSDGQQGGEQEQSGQSPESRGGSTQGNSPSNSPSSPSGERGERGEGRPSGEGNREGDSPLQAGSQGAPSAGTPPAAGGNRRGGPRSLSEAMRNPSGEGGGGGGPESEGNRTGPRAPLTGDEFQEFSDRLRDVEEMLPTPELRNRAAQIRDRAREVRVDVRRHSQAPNWELVRTSIYGPMLELESRIAEELARRNPQQQLVPVDRDPVPEKYQQRVETYYRELSRQSGVAP
ncbi:hypothetical protein [Planctomicrobium sp. SH664]|uniref:hypothetical protein n=1 Tax=Planctomicrobium sp. SH664 TaxID=3448125 RepID=UPI003F5B6746